ncbi:MAG: dicarboxylate/amino acid:cation symporter [Planctomycetota bacterium]
MPEKPAPPASKPARTKGLAIHWRILIGLGLGVVVGIVINLLMQNRDGGFYQAVTGDGFIGGVAGFLANLNGFIGDLFLRGLRFIAVPIVLFSLIVGAGGVSDMAKLGRIGGKTIGAYLMTTAIAITVGLVLANIVDPGSFVGEETRAALEADQAEGASTRIATAQERAGQTVWDTMLNLVPTNPFNALAVGNTLQVVTAALLIGIALTSLPKDKSEPVLRFCDGMTEVIIKIVHWVMAIAPYAVFCLLVRVVADLGFDVLGALVAYSLTVIAALAVMIFAVYPLAIRPLAKVRYGRFFKAIAPAQLLAFSSSSSGATMPVTMECCKERLGVGEDVTSFVIPVGATINMDGTALYQGVATLFIAQLFGLDLSVSDQLTIVLTATLASIGTAAVPGVGMVMLVIVLQALPQITDEMMATGVAVIFGVDRILDMCRTTCNVTSDCAVAAVVAASEGELAEEGKAPRDLEIRA